MAEPVAAPVQVAQAVLARRAQAAPARRLRVRVSPACFQAPAQQVLVVRAVARVPAVPVADVQAALQVPVAALLRVQVAAAVVQVAAVAVAARRPVHSVAAAESRRLASPSGRSGQNSKCGRPRA